MAYFILCLIFLLIFALLTSVRNVLIDSVGSSKSRLVHHKGVIYSEKSDEKLRVQLTKTNANIWGLSSPTQHICLFQYIATYSNKSLTTFK